MGIKTSPYLTTNNMVCLEEFIQGYPLDCDNPFQWSNTHLNLPGDYKYLPSLTWVSNIINEGNLEADFWTYIDNIRSIPLS